MRSRSRPAAPVPGARDPFRVLALPYDAGPDDVRRAFRRLARQTHPDRGGAADAFHAVLDAYRVLVADLEAERTRWRPTPTPPRRFVGPDPRTYPTCPVRVGRTRDGRRTVAFETEARPPGWRPPPAPPRGGACEATVAATEAAPAFGVWAVPLDAHTVRYVFGPPAEPAT